ncbi:hypothetical protein CALCODRAFT_490515 [Calocera cornea HHB12733]|uniref:BSD domain-containing protein n=1 Tax=Calocera cornea HHB12733 TaxID=1353952 RepID=A0A165JKZ6_9BASI|nr:hypothetical protein CALCODRAFT_490515 [Calocera cornea HHB12733]
MNTDLFFNPVPVAGTPTAEGEEADKPQQSLEEEVNQVVGQLGKLWGGFRKQSASAFDLAKKDLTSVVGQARTELSKLGQEASQRISVELNRPPTVTSPKPSSEEGDATVVPDVAEGAAADAVPAAGASASVESAAAPAEGEASTSPAGASTSSFFDRLQSSLPPNITRAIPPSTSASLAALRQDLAAQFNHFQTTFSADLTSMEGIAQEYSRKGEQLLKDAGVKGEALFKETAEFIKEAVKNVPNDSTSTEGMIWDGSDLWALPGLSASMAGADRSQSTSAQAGPSTSRSSGDLRVPTTRAEVLLAQLRRTPGVLRVDPSAEPRSAPEWESWSAEQWGEEWQKKTEGQDTGELKDTKDALVPGELDEETFWKRYFFRVYQIERDEERRKALLSGMVVCAAVRSTLTTLADAATTTQKEEDFSWDDDEETAPAAATATTAETAGASTTTLTLPDSTVTPRASSSFESTPAPALGTPAGTGVIALSSGAPSPRQSSDDSFDVVGTDSAAGTDAGGSAKVKEGKSAKEDKDDSEDSDWE